MAQRNDQIFQLSLTEIAFTISFILLLLLGYLVFKEESARLAAEAALADIQTAERATESLNTAKRSFTDALQKGGTSNADEVITKLIAADEARMERDRLKQRVEDLDSKLTALTELQNQLDRAAKIDRPDITKEEIDSALALQDKVLSSIEQESTEKGKPTREFNSSISANSQLTKDSRKKQAFDMVEHAFVATGELKKQLKAQLNKELPFGQEAQTVQEVVSAAKNFGDLSKGGSSTEIVKKENSDLRGQVAFLKNRLDARGGRDFPPCWADENGKVEFLLSIEVKPDLVVVNPAWPPRREVAAHALPGIDELLENSLSNQKFVSGIQGIFNWSKKQDPECRHYVQLKSSITDAIQSDRARLMVENYFYKVESRR